MSAMGLPRVEMRVLAVDDNIIDRKIIEMLLKTSSFNVTAVKNPMEALDVLGLMGTGPFPRTRKLEFDLIISDYSMPGMTGYELLRRIKHSASPYKDVPMVIMSAENPPSRIARCMAEGAKEFFVKPVQFTAVQRLKEYVLHLKETRAHIPTSPVPVSVSVTFKRKSSGAILPLHTRTNSGVAWNGLARSVSLPGQTMEKWVSPSEIAVA